jgi:amidophosphoribosyltransferase
MSTINELFAPRFLDGGPLTDKVQDEMAKKLRADSLRYLPVDAIARAIGFESSNLCQACITGEYPTRAGQELYDIALKASKSNSTQSTKRTYDTEVELTPTE